MAAAGDTPARRTWLTRCGRDEAVSILLFLEPHDVLTACIGVCSWAPLLRSDGFYSTLLQRDTQPCRMPAWHPPVTLARTGALGARCVYALFHVLRRRVVGLWRCAPMPRGRLKRVAVASINDTDFKVYVEDVSGEMHEARSWVLLAVNPPSLASGAAVTVDETVRAFGGLDRCRDETVGDACVPQPSDFRAIDDPLPLRGLFSADYGLHGRELFELTSVGGGDVSAAAVVDTPEEWQCRNVLLGHNPTVPLPPEPEPPAPGAAPAAESGSDDASVATDEAPAAAEPATAPAPRPQPRPAVACEPCPPNARDALPVLHVRKLVGDPNVTSGMVSVRFHLDDMAITRGAITLRHVDGEPWFEPCMVFYPPRIQSGPLSGDETLRDVAFATAWHGPVFFRRVFLGPCQLPPS